MCLEGVQALGCQSGSEPVACRDWLLLQGAELAKVLSGAKHLPPLLACWRSKPPWETNPKKVNG